MNENITQKPIVEELKKNFVIYANEVNRNRAFPHTISGLKPVAAHILWAMWANSRRSNKPYTKSAKVTGEVMSYSPHGDSYSSLARMAADYIYHIPYIDGKGSFGSAIGGPTPASSRYTECRLSKFIEDVLFYNTKLLNMGKNYLEEDDEPILQDWTALLPLLFITNTSGIGFTMSNSWSSGNLFEFKEQLENYLKTGKVDCSKIYPDFPTGGVIINKSEMKELYETGKGVIKLRGNVEIVGDVIKITSLPYQSYPEQFIEDVKKYVNNNQHTIKDVSNKSGVTGLLIEVECEKDTATYTLDQLYRKTCLQTSIAEEHKAVDESSQVVLVSFKEYMRSFVESNIRLVVKEAQYNLEEIDKRLELVNGLLNALDIIDEIIKTIKKSKSMDDAKKAIMNMKKYEFTEVQADYIVHTPLGRLANLEQVKLKDEKKELDKKKVENTKLLNDRKAQEKYFKDRFDRLVNEYGWERKTSLDDIEMAPIVSTAKPAAVRTKKEFMIVLTSENCLKRIETTKFRKSGEDEKSFKIAGNQKITMVSNKGNMYKVPSNSIEKCLPASAGTSIKDIRPEIGDEQIIAIYSQDTDKKYIYFVTKEGLGKLSLVDKTIKKSKQTGIKICGLKSDTDEIIAIKLLDEGQSIEITSNLKTEKITPDKPQGAGAAGKKIFKLKKDEVIKEVHSI